MKGGFLAILLISILSISYGQSSSTTLTCRSNWQFLTTENKIEGRLIYFLPAADCGYSISASLSIIETTTGDTIRVLNLCDMRRQIPPNTKVQLLPNNEVTKKASIIPLDKTGDCFIIKTYYGQLLLNKTNA